MLASLQDRLLPNEAADSTEKPCNRFSQCCTRTWAQSTLLLVLACLLGFASCIVLWHCANFVVVNGPQAPTAGTLEGESGFRAATLFAQIANGFTMQEVGPFFELEAWVGFIVIVVACLCALAFALQYGLMKFAHRAFEEYDRDYLGVDVKIGNVKLNIFNGRIEITDAKIENPEGYLSPLILSIDRLVIDINTVKALLSRGRQIEIEELSARGVDAYVEYHIETGESNLTAITKHLSDAIAKPSLSSGDIQPVYDFWHERKQAHTFHFDPPWDGEVRGSAVFFAHKTQAPGTEPVYDWWHWWHREQTFHFEPAWRHETQGTAHFFAFREQAPNTEPVHGFWHPGNKEHTLHFLPPWDQEETNDVLMYAYPKDPTGKATVRLDTPQLKPVYSFWHHVLRQHTFHFPPAWQGERQEKVMFYAYDKPVPGTEPVWDFWHSGRSKKTFHRGDPKTYERKGSRLFWVFPDKVKGAEPVDEFYHEGNQESNIHLGAPWEGEKHVCRAFYAYPNDPFGRSYFLRKVDFAKFRASGGTRSVGSSVKIEDMRYDDFSAEFNVATISDIGLALCKAVFKKISVNVFDDRSLRRLKSGLCDDSSSRPSKVGFC